MTDQILASRKDDAYFKARTTQIQFASLAVRCDRSKIITELNKSRFRRNLHPAKNIQHMEIEKWLLNGWNTEYLLRANQSNLQSEALRYSLQWAFPQAYYSAYAVTMGFFQAVGYTESSHSRVIGKLGALIIQGSYPRSLAFAADGGKNRRYYQAQKSPLNSSIHFDRDDPKVVDTHICHFLNATRKLDLESKKADLRLKRKDGKPKKQFNHEDWEKASNKIGPTNLLSLLYRKRIKANYQDIDTFVSEHLSADNLYDDLVCIVDAINFTHEAFVAQIFGHKRYSQICKEKLESSHQFVFERLDLIAKFET